MKLRRRLSFGVVVVVFGLIAASCSTDSGRVVIGQGISADACYYGRADNIIPAANGSAIDVKGFVYKYDRNYGCSTGYAAKVFYYAEASVRAVLYRASDLAICSSTGWTATRNGEVARGIGQTWNKTGACSSTSSFITAADGSWQPGNSWNVYAPTASL